MQDLLNKCFEDSTHTGCDHSGPSGGPIERWRTRTRCCWMTFHFPMWMLGGLVVAGYSGYIVLCLIIHHKTKFRKKNIWAYHFFCEGWFHLVPECFRHFRTFDVGLSHINSFPTKNSLLSGELTFCYGKIHHFSWENPLFRLGHLFHCFLYVHQRVDTF